MLNLIVILHLEINHTLKSYFERSFYLVLWGDNVVVFRQRIQKEKSLTA